MATTADAVIIGGGIMGLFTAQALVEQEFGRVRLIEKRFVGAGSSGKSGAILRQHYSHETTVRMARESLAHYRSFAERTGRDIGFKPTPLLFLCHERDRPALEANVKLQRSLGVEVEMLDAAAIRDLEPRGTFEDEVIGAFETESAYVEPARALAALAALCSEATVEVSEGEAVSEVLVESGRVSGVMTETGTVIETRTVINAGGPWAGRICRRLGLELPLKAIRPQQAYFSPPARYGHEQLIFGDLVTGLYWKPEPAGWTRVGMMSYEGDEEILDPDDYDEGVSRSFIESCRQGIARRLPAYGDAVSWGGCAALYTVTPDAHALIGPVPGVDGLYIVSGFSGHGFKMGPAVGHGLAALITKGDPAPLDPAFFAVDRFEHGGAITTAYQYGLLG
jgi:sarcosine oxidase subunit beta